MFEASCATFNKENTIELYYNVLCRRDQKNSQQRLFTYYLRQAGKNGCVGLSLACNFIKKGLNLEVFL